MANRTQPFVAILIALFFGTIGFSALNNQNSLNQLQQTLGVLSASVQNQTVPSSAANTTANTESDKQVQASSEITEIVEQATQLQTNDHALQISGGEVLFLLRDMQTVTVSLSYNPNITSTDSLTVQVQLLIAQNKAEETLNVGYHSNASTITLSAGVTQTVPLHFETLPPTGSYKAQLVAYNKTTQVTQLVTLVVANQPSMTLQHRLTDLTNDKEIVITGVRYLPIWGSFSWSRYELLLWEKYLRPNSYHIVFSELADSVNGRIGRLGLVTDTHLVSVTNAGAVSISLLPAKIYDAGAYTGTLSIVDTNDYRAESIRVTVRARDHWWIPFVIILIATLVVGWAGRNVLGKVDENIVYLKYRISILQKRYTDIPVCTEASPNPACKQVLLILENAEMMLTLQDAIRAKVEIDQAEQKLNDLRDIPARLEALRPQNKDKDFEQAERAFQLGDMEGAKKSLDKFEQTQNTAQDTDTNGQTSGVITDAHKAAIQRIKRVALLSQIVWALIAAVAGILYIETSLPIFGSCRDYFAVLGWAFGVGAVGSSAPAVLKSIKDLLQPKPTSQ